MNSRRGFGVVGIIIIAIFALGLVAVGYYVGHKNTLPAVVTEESISTTIVTTTLAPLPTPTPAASTTVATGVANQKKYTNPSAGISFLFAGTSNGETYDVKEVGDTIYVYDTKYPYTQGQYVKVFPKNPADTLTQGIQKALLTGIAPADCFVKDAKGDSGAKFPATYEVKTLGFPVDQNSDVPAFAQDNKCPANYAETNGLSYFLGDTAHPKTFLFFSIGQYGINSAPNSDMTWQDTVEFLN